MSGNYQPPKERTPIALRLVPRIAGYTVRELVGMLTVPVPHGDRDIIYLESYQWPDKNNPKPASVLKLLLEPALKAQSEKDAIAAIPPELFVWSDNLENCTFDSYFDAAGEPPTSSVQPDWNPYISDIKALIEKCPHPLRAICPISKHKSRDQGKKETTERNDLLQTRCNDILKKEPNLPKDTVAIKLSQLPEFKNMGKARIMRIIRTRGKSI